MKTTVPYTPELIWIRLVGSRPFFRPEAIEDLTRALMAYPEFTPEVYGLDERSSFPFDQQSAMNAAEGHPTAHTLHLRRKKRIKFHCMASLGHHPDCSLKVDPKLPASAWSKVFELGEAIFAACQPEILWVHLTSPTQPPFDEEWKRVQSAIDHSLTSGRTKYPSFGPGGLTLRTFLGRRLVDMIGRERVLSAPVAVEEMAQGVRLDLTSKPWTATAEQLRAAWVAAREHFAESRVFAEMQVSEGGAVDYKKGTGFTELAIG